MHATPPKPQGDPTNTTPRTRSIRSFSPPERQPATQRGGRATRENVEGVFRPPAHQGQGLLADEVGDGAEGCEDVRAGGLRARGKGGEGAVEGEEEGVDPVAEFGGEAEAVGGGSGGGHGGGGAEMVLMRSVGGRNAAAASLRCGGGVLLVVVLFFEMGCCSGRCREVVSGAVDGEERVGSSQRDTQQEFHTVRKTILTATSRQSLGKVRHWEL